MWHSMAIDGVTLVDALRCWEGSKVTTNRPRQEEVGSSLWEEDPYEVRDVKDQKEKPTKPHQQHDFKSYYG